MSSKQSIDNNCQFREGGADDVMDRVEGGQHGDEVELSRSQKKKMKRKQRRPREEKKKKEKKKEQKEILEKFKDLKVMGGVCKTEFEHKFREVTITHVPEQRLVIGYDAGQI